MRQPGAVRRSFSSYLVKEYLIFSVRVETASATVVYLKRPLLVTHCVLVALGKERAKADQVTQIKCVLSSEPSTGSPPPRGEPQSTTSLTALPRSSWFPGPLSLPPTPRSPLVSRSVRLLPPLCLECFILRCLFPMLAWPTFSWHISINSSDQAQRHGKASESFPYKQS